MVRLRTKRFALFLSTLMLALAIGALLPAKAAFAANPVIVRGLFVGCGDYAGDMYDLAPDTLNDANECCYVFNNAYYDNGSRVKGKMVLKTNVRRSTLLSCLNPSGTSSAFYGADTNDVSVFFFSGHGVDFDEYGRPAIVVSDGSADDTVSVDALEAALHKIPGTKIVILDSCFSGAVIGKSSSRNAALVPSAKEASPTAGAAPSTAAQANPSPTIKPPTQAELQEFADALIHPFAEANRTARDLLSKPEYIVFNACAGYDFSYSEGDGADSMGLFTRAFTDGLGRLGQHAADANTNKTVTVDEAYDAARDLYYDYYRERSTAQVYPRNSSYTLMRYLKNGAVAKGKLKTSSSVYTSTLSQKTVLGRINAGTTVNVYGALGNYYKVYSGGSYGYVHKNNTSIVSGTAEKPRLGVGKAKKTTYVYTSTSTSSRKLRTLGAGTRMDIMGVSGSYYIVTAGGVTGCVPANMVTVVSGSVGPAPTSRYVLAVGKTSGSTYVYKSASASSAKVRALKTGARVTITSVSSAYYKVWAYGNIGYVPRSKVNIVSGTLGGKAPKSTNTSINALAKANEKCYVYSSGTTSSPKRGTLKKGARICVLSVKGNFYRVLYKGKTGSVVSKRLKILTPEYFSGAGEARSKCYVYESRTMTSAKKLTLHTGGCVSILGVYGNFYKVTVSGVNGYIPVKFIKVL
ncbi:MAG: hypothetical protein GXY11_01095 [Clostridiales bacterium]|nr:hypothetical protein [Clostridiales bacterium]